MKYVYIARKGDRESVIKNYNYYSEVSNNELIKTYNGSVKTGIVGVHAQALFLIALRKAFLERFGKSPVTVEDKIIIGLSGKIRQTQNSYSHLEKVSLIYKEDTVQDIYLDSVIETETDFEDLSKVFDNHAEAVLLRVNHNQRLTTLNLTDISPYILLFFDDELLFQGASYAIQNTSGAYSLKTEYRTILLIRTDLKINLKDLLKIIIYK